MTYADAFNIRTANVKFNDVADAIDGTLTRAWGGTTAGTTTAYTANPSPVWTAYVNGAILVVVPHATNTGACTLNVSGLGTASIRKNGVDVPAGEFVINQPTLLVYSGGVFNIYSGTTGNLTIQGNFVANGGNITARKTSGLPIISATSLQAAGYAPAMLGMNRTGISGDATPNNEVIGEIRFDGADANGAYMSAAQITAFIGTNAVGGAPGTLTFRTAPSGSGPVERMRITSAGNVGINVTSPGYPLDVQAESAVAVAMQMRGRASDGVSVFRFTDFSAGELGRLASSNDAVTLAAAGARKIIFKTNGLDRGEIRSNGHFVVGDGTSDKGCVINGGASGTNDGSYFSVQNGGATIIAIGNYSAIVGGTYANNPTIYGNGVVFKVNNLTAGAGTHTMKWNNSNAEWTYDTSSARYKENIRPSVYGLDALMQMLPRQYNYKDSDREDVGFVAEELVEIIPELVPLNVDGYPDAVSYDRLTAVLCKALQELAAKVEALEAQIAPPQD